MELFLLLEHRNDANGSYTGHVRVYKYSSGSWNRLGGDIDGEAAGDLSGESVSLSSDGTIVAIGSYYNDGNGNKSGHVRVYQYEQVKITDQSSNTWNRLGEDIDGEAESDQSGWYVSLNSDTSSNIIVAIGARYNDGTDTNDNRSCACISIRCN